MSTEITRALTVVRTGTREDALDVEVAFAPVGDEPTEWTNVTMSVFLFVNADTRLTQVDLDLVRDGESRTTASVPIDNGIDIRKPVSMRAIIMHGTRHYGMQEITV